MRIADDCEHCPDGRALVYATIQGHEFTTRYRRCDSCGETSKTIQKKTSSLSLSSKQPMVIDSDIDTITTSVSISHSHGE